MVCCFSFFPFFHAYLTNFFYQVFYICCNLAVLNLFVGFVIDSFLDTFKEEQEAEEDMTKWKARLKASALSEDREIERIN